MPEYIPFINTPTDRRILNQYYSDCEMVRLPLESAGTLVSEIPQQAKIWLDPCVDGYHHRLNTNWPHTRRAEWREYYTRLWNQLDRVFGTFRNYELLADPNEWKKPNQSDLDCFIDSLMNKCTHYKPTWISVPQLPIAKGPPRDKINKMLARATGQWKRNADWFGKLVLPIIFTNQNQLSTPSTQKKKLASLVNCYDLSGANSIWVVDESLTDQQRNSKYIQRYSKLIKFHQRVRNRFGSDVSIIAGPYWAINLILWARELCDYPAISLGSSYKYNISCGVPGGPPVNRVVLSPVKRVVVVEDQLREWLEDSLTKLDNNDTAFFEFNEILRNFSKLKTTRITSLSQTVQSYRNWLKNIENKPKAGRKFALYQDLSSAYVIGSQLKDLPPEAVPYASAPIRKAGKVAEQLMLSCL